MQEPFIVNTRAIYIFLINLSVPLAKELLLDVISEVVKPDVWRERGIIFNSISRSAAKVHRE